MSPTEKQKVQILAISIDPHEESRLMIEEITKYPGKLDFPLLFDRDHLTVDRYGIYHPAEVKPGIPYTITYIIKPDGTVFHRFYDETGHRPGNEQLREQLKALGVVS